MARHATIVALLGLATAAWAQPAAYRLAPPAGWAGHVDGDTLRYAAPGEPAGTAVLMLLPVQPLSTDFNAQFARERASLERAWGLRDPQGAPPQQGRSAAGEFAASFASYASERGDRYVSWHALASKGRFALVVFVAHSSAAYNRHRTAAAEVFNRLTLTDDAGSIALPAGTPDRGTGSPSTSTTASLPAPPESAAAARVIGTWSSFRAPANGPTITPALIAQAGFGSWWQFRADGSYRHVRAYGRGPMSWDGSVDEGRWTLAGDRLTVHKLTSSPLAALDDPAQWRTRAGTYKPLTWRVGWGPGGELLLSDPPVDWKLAPAR